MLQQISLGVLIVSFLVLVIILIKKAPVLADIKISTKKEESFLFIFQKRIMNIPFVKKFSWNKFLQKILSRIRIMTLKIEGKVGEQLHFLRKMSKKKKK